MGLYITKRPIVTSVKTLMFDLGLGLGLSTTQWPSFSISPVYSTYKSGLVRAVPLMAIQSGGLTWASWKANQRLDRSTSLNDAERASAKHNFFVLTWGSAATSAFFTVGGNNETPDLRCWEQILGPEVVSKMDDGKRALYSENGMLLQDVAAYCTPFKSDDEDEVLILRNDQRQYFAFSITETVEAGACKENPDFKHKVVLLHAVPVVCGSEK
ncbi:unnamed protein product [Rhizoctonia solani]|uniref:Uncharacterized protein n=1 Tax=Rhizoctonia solani TaxID=456999 RepID=A0A8H3HHM8_9AGAM|nr:unnamed protein product [Rhizoctonia solani]